ncbi:MAG: protein kinase, partial [Sandaracinaceae bacterium]
MSEFPAVSARDLVGRTLGGVYRLEATLGAGGVGVVYLARHARTRREYAVKVLKPELAAREDALGRFSREAEAISALRHANVVAVHDFVVDGELAFLVMDRLEGEVLAHRIASRAPMPVHEVIGIARGIAAGLEAAHARGLLHRDVKPANVMLAREPGLPERPVLLDFGLAKAFGRDGELDLTRSGMVIGTPMYMSPEQANGARLDARTDVYSLACVVFEMLTGQVPFDAPTVPALFAKLLREPAPLVRWLRPDVSPALESVVATALEKDPARRYPSPSAFVDALAAAVDSGARPDPSPAQLPTPQGLTPQGLTPAPYPPSYPHTAPSLAATLPPRAPSSPLRWLAPLVFVTVACLGTSVGVGGWWLSGALRRGAFDEPSPDVGTVAAAGSGGPPAPDPAEPEASQGTLRPPEPREGELAAAPELGSEPDPEPEIRPAPERAHRPPPRLDPPAPDRATPPA